MIALGIANNYPSCIADHNSKDKRRLPFSDIFVSGGSHGQVNKFDTYKAAQLGLNVLSRISRHLIGKINAFVGSPYYNCCQNPYAYFNIEDENAQSPKTTNPNRYTPQPRDLTAYEYNLYLLRGQSFHSSSTTKASSRKSLFAPDRDFNTKDKNSLNLKTDSEFQRSVDSRIIDELNKYMSKNGKYNGIINILANPYFLQECYLLIRSKPGNMSLGTNEETLDGINLE